MRCHALYGVGESVGPDITGSNRSDLDYLLENVLDPNALVPNEYRVTLVRTDDGRLVTGILIGESNDALTLRTENETLTIALSEIDERKLDSISMMPEDQLATLDEEEAAALIAYLRHDGQVPRLVTEENRASFFDGQSLAGWSGDEELWSVEDGEIVGRTQTGLGHNAFLVSDFLLRDFRLVVEVRLTPDGANSGIQFRSRPVEGGEVHGYQADAGEGWWGKLYEELGRGTLFADPGAGFVRVNEWNTYEILAVGDHIRTAINGHPCVDLEDPEGAREGQIALQIHSGPALEVRFRHLEIDLDPHPELRTVAE
jgi:putative heme-binding domain-containing protein